MIEVYKTDLTDVLRIIPPTKFRDNRGDYIEIYNEAIYNEAGIKVKFIQDDISISKKRVLRGIHGDFETWKLITCLHGNFWLIVTDIRCESSDFRRWTSFLMKENDYQILIPPGFGNGHMVMSDYSIFHYKQSTIYDRSKQFTIAWNDPLFQFYWPLNNPILSERDKGFQNVT